MAYLILEDTRYKTDVKEYCYFDFDMTNSETLEKIEAVFAARKAQSSEGRELLSHLCSSSFERTSPPAEKNAMAIRLKKMFRLLINKKKEMSNRWGIMKNHSRNQPSNHLIANGRVVQTSYGS
jgi:hypothetical protein